MSVANFFTLLGILAGPLIAFASSMYFRKRDDTRDVKKTCAFLAQHFDEFAYECDEVISNNELFSSSDGHAGNLTLVAPKFGEWPDTVDLRLVEPETLSKVLAFGLKRSLSDKRIAFLGDVGEQDSMPVETDQQCGVLGSEALEIADALRTSAKLPDPNYTKYHWDVAKTLHKQRDAALKHLVRKEDDDDARKD